MSDVDSGEKITTEGPYPTEHALDPPQFEDLTRALCARPSMYVGRPSFAAVCAYIDGFNLARSGGPLIGFREWLVVRANAGNNLHWPGLASRLISPNREPSVDQGEEVRRCAALGRLIEEYLRFRDDTGITKVFYDYGQWLLRKRWYRGPLRKKRS